MFKINIDQIISRYYIFPFLPTMHNFERKLY